jgi:hypothetical protein
MNYDTTLPFAFPAVCRKKISAALDGSSLSFGGVMLARYGGAEAGDRR